MAAPSAPPQHPRFLQVAAVEVTPISPKTADAYALLYRSLRRQSTPIPSNDPQQPVALLVARLIA
jgi:hypothetical protein